MPKSLTPNAHIGDPVDQPNLVPRKRWQLRERFVLVLAPTATVLLVYGFVELLSHRRLLFTSLAASSFLIYLGPHLRTNQVRTVALSQVSAATIGLGAYFLFGPGYLSAGTAMIVSITLMVLLDVIHPPAVGTALAFGFRAESLGQWGLFIFAVGLVCLLAVVQSAVLRALFSRHRSAS